MEKNRPLTREQIEGIPVGHGMRHPFPNRRSMRSMERGMIPTFNNRALTLGRLKIIKVLFKDEAGHFTLSRPFLKA